MRILAFFRNALLRSPILIGIGITIAALFISGASSWLLYNKTSQLLEANLRERLISIVTTAVVQFDAHDIEQLRVESDWTRPEWAKVVHQMEKIRKNNSKILFVYIIRKMDSDTSKMEFVSDSHSIDPYAKIDINNDGVIDDGDQLQWPGQPYPTAPDEAMEAYNGPRTNKDIYSDQWGPVLTGYAPIKDASGKTIAVLATDIKAGDFFTIITQTLYPFLLFIAILAIIIAVLAAALIYIWERRAKMHAQFSGELEMANETVYKHSLDLVRLKKELEIANAQQENLLHFMSHEIKGYFTNAAAGFAAIVEGDFGPITPELKTMAESALSNMRKGVSTIMDILNASDMKKGAVSFKKKPVNFRTVVERVVAEQKSAAYEKHLGLDVQITEGQYELTGDEEKLRDNVVRNLIDNAIRYTPAGTILVRLSDGDRKIHFSVKDSGVGITPEDMARLFTEGGHGKDSIKTNVHSTGYGLFIAKQIVDAHGGKIWAESDGEGKGARFVVELSTV